MKSSNDSLKKKVVELEKKVDELREDASAPKGKKKLQPSREERVRELIPCHMNRSCLGCMYMYMHVLSLH